MTLWSARSGTGCCEANPPASADRPLHFLKTLCVSSAEIYTSAPSAANSPATAAPIEPPAPKTSARFPCSICDLFIRTSLVADYRLDLLINAVQIRLRPHADDFSVSY